jgi:hypothetical protein
MSGFTPVSGLVGGALIGLAAALLLLGSGRIAGISGILKGSLFPEAGDLGWRLAFLVGLPLGAWLATQASADAMGFTLDAGPARLVCAGLLVGFGSALGNGCTSGHGVCGISRGSRRSLVATAVFMLTGIATVLATRHLLGAS